jgi:hypothetical protein
MSLTVRQMIKISRGAKARKAGLINNLLVRAGLRQPPRPRHGINAVSPGRNALGALGLGGLATGGAIAAANPAETAELFGGASDAAFEGMKGVYNPGIDPNAPGEAAFAQYMDAKDRLGGFGPEPDPDDVDYNPESRLEPNIFNTSPDFDNDQYRRNLEGSTFRGNWPGGGRTSMDEY